MKFLIAGLANRDAGKRIADFLLSSWIRSKGFYVHHSIDLNQSN